MRALWTTALLTAALAAAGCDAHDHKHDDGHGEDHGRGRGVEPAASQDTAVNGRARDPVCGMTVAVKGAKTGTHRETRFYFCSAACLAKFEKDPASTTTGLPGEACVCSTGEMKECPCGHCVGEPERCACGDEAGHAEEHDH